MVQPVNQHSSSFCFASAYICVTGGNFTLKNNPSVRNKLIKVIERDIIYFHFKKLNDSCTVLIKYNYFNNSTNYVMFLVKQKIYTIVYATPPTSK